MSNSVIVLEYDGMPVRFTEDGWFNATHVAAKFDKEPFDWLRQAETVKYIVALCKAMGNSGFVPEFNKINELAAQGKDVRRMLADLGKRTGLVRTKAGAPENGGGTWMHPKLGVPYARWLDVYFAVWCDMQIENILRGGATSPVALRMEYITGYHELHDVIQAKSVASSKPWASHMNVNKVINKTLEIQPGQRGSLPVGKLALATVAQQIACAAFAVAHDHHDGYENTKVALANLGKLLPSENPIVIEQTTHPPLRKKQKASSVNCQPSPEICMAPTAQNS
ncbi:KilA-N domain-containing protein [Diaphorobacter sp. HDW4B]|uniref:KilA-N domain-containing protein n=1 Tax=Diaphorobacter sp. HDW4B TaxID=2714925 RepID=UPI00140DA53A|nr:KilA-N domain-containing protein [Diaphorobacter sp. HDW4B]QIL71635.1 KilA-N domain-containing protein [Diaphorobacter sp. HDW4B]